MPKILDRSWKLSLHEIDEFLCSHHHSPWFIDIENIKKKHRRLHVKIIWTRIATVHKLQPATNKVLFYKQFATLQLELFLSSWRYFVQYWCLSCKSLCMVLYSLLSITVPRMAQFHSTHFARLRSFCVVVLHGTAIECTKFTEHTCTAFLVKPFVWWCLFVSKLYTCSSFSVQQLFCVCKGYDVAFAVVS